MAVRTRQDAFDCETRIDTTEILNCSRLVSTITGFPVQPNKAIVGANAFAHESGIHQDGVLKRRETYEIMRAQDVGWQTNRIVLGKLSGRNAFRTRLTEIGIEFTRQLKQSIDLAVGIRIGIGRTTDHRGSILKRRHHEFVGPRII